MVEEAKKRGVVKNSSSLDDVLKSNGDTIQFPYLRREPTPLRIAQVS